LTKSLDITLDFSYIGFESEIILIDPKIQPYHIDLKLSEDVLGELVIQKPSIFQRFLNLFRSKENKHY